MISTDQHSFRLDTGHGFGHVDLTSYAGRNPFQVIRAWGNRIEIETAGEIEHLVGDPLTALKAILDRNTHGVRKAKPGLASGGMVGYLGYGLRRWTEQVAANNSDDLGLPDLWFGCYDNVKTQSMERTRARGEESVPLPSDETGRTWQPERSTYSRTEYLSAIEHIKRYITAGDVYQVNLTQRFSCPFEGSSEALYDQLLRINPSPFAAYLDCGSFQVVSASPERFMKLNPITRIVETSPIKGTRPRGRHRVADQKMADELLASGKDRAEHVMIVDLERNDLGRVCDTGTIKVPDLISLDPHPSVWHLVSTVTGHLRDDADRIDLIRAAFPGGSITGAPKIRAMEIIDEVEPLARGIYTGAIGYFGFDGSMDFNIAIRSIVVTGGTAYVYVGGGIVADSDPASEYQETLDKGRAMFGALSEVGG